MSNSDDTKKVIQSVSGVGGDLMDTSGESMRLLQAMGVLKDLTAVARERGFGPDSTYEAVVPDLMVDGRQYRYPANVGTGMMWVNVDLLRRYGLEPPPTRWTWDDFEQLGVAFKAAANPPDTPPSKRKYLASDVNLNGMVRGIGVDPLNETLTSSALNDPRFVLTLETRKRWIFDLNILPSRDDIAAAATQQGYGGSALQLFGREQYAIVPGGRWLLVQLRRFTHLRELDVVEPPHHTLPVTPIQTRAVVLYAGSRHPELATLFLEFLASDAYNRTIIEDGDAMPPNPALTRSEAFRNPPQFPHEHGLHDRFAAAAKTIAVPTAYSPYILPSIVHREFYRSQEAFFSGRLTAEQAAARAAANLDRAIIAHVRRRPELWSSYTLGLARQRVIDRLKAEGQPLPAAWIQNPVHRAYYQHLGLLTHETPPDPEPVPLLFGAGVGGGS